MQGFRNPPRSKPLEPTPQQAATLPKREGGREEDKVFNIGTRSSSTKYRQEDKLCDRLPAHLPVSGGSQLAVGWVPSTCCGVLCCFKVGVCAKIEENSTKNTIPIHPGIKYLLLSHGLLPRWLVRLGMPLHCRGGWTAGAAVFVAATRGTADAGAHGGVGLQVAEVVVFHRTKVAAPQGFGQC